MTTDLGYNTTLQYANPVTVDSEHNRIYTFGTPSAGGTPVIRYVNYPAGTGVSYPRPTNLLSVSALEYRDGFLYMVGTNSSGTAALFRYVPTVTAGAALMVTTAALEYPMDILVKSDYIYVANYNSITPANHRILKFDRNTLAFIGAYGTGIPPATPDDNRPGYFYGPFLFLAENNRKIYLIDEATGTGNGQNRVVAFDEVGTWKGWEIFRSEDLNPANEYRYYYC